MSFGDAKDRLAVRAGQSADGGAWFAATHLLHTLWPPYTRVGDIHNDVAKAALVTPFVEVRTDDTERFWSGHCCTVDIFSYYGREHTGPRRRTSTNVNFFRARVGSAEFALKENWDALDFELCSAEDLEWPMPDDMPPISHYRFTVTSPGIATPRAEGPIRMGWSRLAADWGVYAMRVLASSGGNGHNKKAHWGDLKYMGDVDFYEVADYFIHIGEQEW